MAWTEQDRDTLKAAILALASGEKVQTVTYSGPPSRTIVYHPVNLGDMRKLLAEMDAQLQAVAGRPARRLAAFSKGFGTC